MQYLLKTFGVFKRLVISEFTGETKIVSKSKNLLLQRSNPVRRIKLDFLQFKYPKNKILKTAFGNSEVFV